ncbi:MAG: glutamate formimidoyltransferase [Candidatus Kapabacteria bacterium]|nr:glutamate formimidoyltransferase [Candidatus Kapabacteria bacterium]
MKKIVECVPNFSEGRNTEIIEAIADAIRKTNGVTLLDVDPGRSTNRTVYSFVGSPEAVIEGALNSARCARKLIDMRTQQGEHPRMGAMDVCPFIPVSGVTMEECVTISKEFAARSAEELNIPIYLYEEASEIDYRKKLPQIREGEYEGLAEKIIKPEWKPDFGPANFVPEWGATVTGARFFLIAYNVNILGTKEQAHRIALNIREAGRSDSEPGLLKETKAIGWFVDEYNMAQVSINLTNYKISPPHIAFEVCKQQAEQINIAVAGTELVGLIPLEAMLMAANYYIEKENLLIWDEEQKIKLVIERLGLNSISIFDPKKRIIEYMIESGDQQPLANLSVIEFVHSVSARSSAPGGGSVSALIAAVGAGLGAMVAKLTYGVRKFENVDSEIRKIIEPLNSVSNSLINYIDADTNAFNDYMEAMRLPKNTSEEREIRFAAMQAGLKKAIEIPLHTMRLGDSAWDAMIGVACFGNIASKSDIEVGAKALETGIWGAYKNVLINMPQIEDLEYKNTTVEKAEKLAARAKNKLEEVMSVLDKR